MEGVADDCRYAFLPRTALASLRVVLGVVSAEQFREFAQFSDHPSWSCVPTPGHAGPDGDTALAHLAVWLGGLGLIPAAGALLVDRRPLSILCAITLVVCCGSRSGLTGRSCTESLPARRSRPRAEPA